MSWADGIQIAIEVIGFGALWYGNRPEVLGRKISRAYESKAFNEIPEKYK